MKLLLTLLLIITVSGCSTTATVPVIDDKIDVDSFSITHPSRPLPVQKVYIKWEVMDQDGEPYVALKYEDSLEFRKFLNDIERVLKTYGEMLCYYRKKLKEPVCMKEPPHENNENNE